MTELWIQKSTTDVHRLIDNKLPEGSVCTGVTMTALDEGAAEEYVAIINDQEVIVEAPAEESAADVADAIVAQAPKPKKQPKPASASAQVEGENSPFDTRPENEPMFGTQAPAEEEYEYDDSEDDDDEFEDKPKTKSKTKKKK
jgi:hypothetical protein